MRYRIWKRAAREFLPFHLHVAMKVADARSTCSIINTTSTVGFSGSAAMVDYASTKGAITSFTQAKQLIPKGIRVNAVAGWCSVHLIVMKTNNEAENEKQTNFECINLSSSHNVILIALASYLTQILSMTPKSNGPSTG